MGLAQCWEWGQTSPLQGPFTAALAAAPPPVTHKSGLGLSLHLPALLPPLSCGNAAWKCLVSVLGDGLEGCGAELQEKATSWGDKNTFQGETRALFGLTFYPLQDDQSHSEML